MLYSIFDPQMLFSILCPENVLHAFSYFWLGNSSFYFSGGGRREKRGPLNLLIYLSGRLEVKWNGGELREAQSKTVECREVPAVFLHGS